MVQGRAKVVLNGVATIVTPEDGPHVVQKGVAHEFMREDIDAKNGQEDEGDVIGQEWTASCEFFCSNLKTVNARHSCSSHHTADGAKEVFFWQLGSMVLNSDVNPLKVFLVPSHFDNWNVLVPGPLSYHVTHPVYGIAAGIARLFGVSAWDSEYIPAGLHDMARSGGERYRKVKEA